MNLQGVTATKIAAAVSAADTAAATSGWIDTRGMEGTLLLVLSVGIITGTLAFTFQTADNSSGTESSAIVPIGGAIDQVTTSLDDDVFVAAFPATQSQGWIQVVGTVGTGPSLISYTLIALPKYAA
jgi:hypothetical protein